MRVKLAFGVDDRIPDNGLRGRRTGRTRRGRVRCLEPYEDLFGIPIEKAAQICSFLSRVVDLELRHVPASRSNLICAYSSLFGE